MDGSWVEKTIIGTAVGLIFALGPLVLDGIRLMRLVRYINMDLVRFHQLHAIGGDEALAFPLSQKLSEKGILLAWKTQRELVALHSACERDGTLLDTDTYEDLIVSLEVYRDSVGVHSDRVGILVWHPGDGFEPPVPPRVAAAFRNIERDWRQFRSQSVFLQKFVQRYARIPTEKL